MSIKASQLRAARAMMHLHLKDVSAETGLTPNTISRAENGSDAKISTVDALADFYESNGIRFVQHTPAVGVMYAPEGPQKEEAKAT